MQILTGNLSATSGTIFWNGQNINELGNAFCYALLLSLCIFGMYYGKILTMYEVRIMGLHTKSIYLLADVLNMPVVMFCILLVVYLLIS